jgi:hypothetical protein
MKQNHSYKISTLLAAGTVLLCVASFVTPARAWDNNSGTCPFGESDSYWAPGSEEMGLCTNFGNGFYNSGAYPADKEWDDAVSAADWAQYMWYRDNSSNFRITINPTSRGFCNSGSFDNRDERSQIGFVGGNEADWIDSSCADDSLGCEQSDHYDCFGWGDNEMIASDIQINRSKPWQVIAQYDTVRCLQDAYYSVENTIMHELGHSYGLKHVDGTSVMNPNKPRVRNCDVYRSFHDYPNPDDFGGFMEHHQGYSGNRYNVAGTPWYRSGSTGTIDRRIINLDASHTSANVTFSYTLHSFYPNNIASYTVNYFFLGWTLPTYNTSTKTWSTPAAVVYPGWLTFVENVNRSSVTQTVTGPLLRSRFPYGQWRLWVQVDSGGAVNERQESDNVFPTDVVVVSQ